jgi:hypothetical protein
MASMRSAKTFSYEDNVVKNRIMIAVLGLGLALSAWSPVPLRAEDTIEKAGVAVGVTAGNMWLLPVKAIVVVVGAVGGALSYVVTGGNAELTRQIWQDTTEAPYVITPELARASVGQRPELAEKN